MVYPILGLAVSIGEFDFLTLLFFDLTFEFSTTPLLRRRPRRFHLPIYSYPWVLCTIISAYCYEYRTYA